jgi:DNA-binding NtrC family response regulator
MPADEKPDLKPSLAGMRVLLVEDEYYIADDVQRILTAAGAEIVGPMPTVAQAQSAIEDGAFDCVVLDLNLHGESAVPLAERLAQEGQPFAIATGYGSPAVPDRLKGKPRIEKPFDPEALVKLAEGLNSTRV